MRTIRRLWPLALFLGLALPARAQDSPPVDLADPARAEADRTRDAHSKPIEVFRWVGVQPGQTVVDFHAGSGYNTWIFSRWVGPDGVVIAEAPAGRAEEIQARLETGDLAEAGNVVYAESIEGLPADSVDVFFVSRNYHDIPAETIPAFLADVRRALKPGGILAVIDARAIEGRDLEAHRIADATIIEEVTAAGFEHADSSELLANPEDDHVGPKWDQREQLDQSLLKFRKPAGDAGADAEPAAQPAPDETETPGYDR